MFYNGCSDCSNNNYMAKGKNLRGETQYGNAMLSKGICKVESM